MRRKSTSQKRLTGTYRPGRDKKRVQFVTSNGEEIKAPAFVRKNKIAYGEWKHVIPHLLSEGILRQTDISLLANYCTIYARWRESAREVEEKGLVITTVSTTRTGRTEKPITNPAVRNEILYSSALVKVGTKLGLNPLDRNRIEVPEAEDENGRDPFDDFLDENDPELDYLELPRRTK